MKMVKKDRNDGQVWKLFFEDGTFATFGKAKLKIVMKDRHDGQEIEYSNAIGIDTHSEISNGTDCEPAWKLIFGDGTFATFSKAKWEMNFEF